MNKVLYAAALLLGMSALLSVSCNQLPPAEENTTASVCFELELNSNSGSMTKASNSEIFDEFYSAMQSGSLVADTYELNLTEVNTGVKYLFSGRWDEKQFFSITTGKYHVLGVSKASGNEFIQDKCSFIFEQDIDVTTSSSTIKITGKYDCFLLIFNGTVFESLNNNSGVDTVPFYTFKTYKYAFVNSNIYSQDYKDDAYIEGTYKNNSFKFYIGKLSFDKGKYYVYNDAKQEFDFPKMDEGDTGNNSDTEQDYNVSYQGEVSIGKNYLKAYTDSIYVNVTNAGMLYPLYYKFANNTETNSEYGEEVWNGVKLVRIDGNIDARDFSTLKWNFRKLTNLDIANTKIVAYSGLYGTMDGSYYDYLENVVPIGAFFYWMSDNIRDFPEELYDEGMASLKIVKLPDGITSIDRNAFARAYNLTNINIPDGVSIIGMCAFRHCHSIEKIYLPKSVTEIGWYTFTDMNLLKEFHVASKSAPSTADSFGFFYDGTNDEYFNESGFPRGDMSPVNYINYDKVTLFVPKGCSSAYTDWNSWFNKIVEE